jgi:hypothetical protein
VLKDNAGIPRASDLPGYITNDDIAESVAESLAFRPTHYILFLMCIEQPNAGVYCNMGSK